MACVFCGEGDRLFKTCHTKDGLIRVCDPCWEALSPWLVVVPGDTVVTARCNGCGAYFNPRDMAEFSPGGRYNAYSGTCERCAKVGAGVQVEILTRLHRTSTGGKSKLMRVRTRPSFEELTPSMPACLRSPSCREE